MTAKATKFNHYAKFMRKRADFLEGRMMKMSKSEQNEKVWDIILGINATS